MSLLSAIFGCPHRNTSRVFTIRKQTYIVCLDCGKAIAYDLEHMKVAKGKQSWSASSSCAAE